jgi:hypothetical protein
VAVGKTPGNGRIYSLPPLFRQYESGRVLTMFGRTPDAGEIAPVVKDSKIHIDEIMVVNLMAD